MNDLLPTVKLSLHNFGEKNPAPKPPSTLDGMQIFKYRGSLATYRGQFDNKEKDGYGIMIYKDGSIYEGDWKRDRRDGYGRYVSAEGDLYLGDWVKDIREGKGISLSLDFSFYDGDWKNDMRHGVGKESYSEGSVYKGEFFKDSKNGKGVLKYKNGRVYEGEMKDDEIHGKGKKNFEFFFKGKLLLRIKADMLLMKGILYTESLKERVKWFGKMENVIKENFQITKEMDME